MASYESQSPNRIINPFRLCPFVNVGMNRCYGLAPLLLSGEFNVSLVSMVWPAESVAGIFEGVGDRKNTFCIIITRNKRPAIHIPGQILHPEPSMLHAIIFFLNGGLTGKTIEKLEHFYLRPGPRLPLPFWDGGAIWRSFEFALPPP